MPRENEEYRDHLEQILRAFPNGELIRKTDAVKYLDARTFQKKFASIDKMYISRTSLARQLSL